MTTFRSTPGARLIDRLRAGGVPLPARPTIRRTRAGRHQLAAGSWRWFIESATGDLGRVMVGSHLTVGELLRADEVTAVMDDLGDVSVTCGPPPASGVRYWPVPRLDKPSTFG